MKREWSALVFAMTFPTLLALIYFVALATPLDFHLSQDSIGPGNRLVQIVYGAGKFIQFSFPILYLLLADSKTLQPGRPHFKGLGLAIGFGLMVGVGILVLYWAGLRSWLIDMGADGRIRIKIEEFNSNTPIRYFGLAAFLSVAHSLLEEYYWRWFVFGRLRNLLSLPLAITISSLAFMAHHVVILGRFLPNDFCNGAVPFSMCIAVGGAYWAWLYNKSGSIYSPWVSHLLVDAAIFAIGYDLVFKS